MIPDSEIGRVTAVHSAQVSVELHRELKGASRSTCEGTREIGRINSYVTIPVGTQRLVATVTRVALEEETPKAHKSTIALPSARKTMTVTLIGTIGRKGFTQGVSDFPVLDSPVHLAKNEDLDAIFRPFPQNARASDAPGYCIRIGESVTAGGRPVHIDPDAFFGKHAAVLGSTGSGKSCTIASILQSIHAHPGVNRTTCVILDTNGEYSSAFPKTGINGKKITTQHVPSDMESDGHLAIPYWFMNAEDFVRIFQAAPGAQRPVLRDALRLARNSADTELARRQQKEGNAPGRSADAPAYFSKLNFRSDHIEDAIAEEMSDQRSRDYLKTMFFRMDTLFEDPRFEFLFGPARKELPSPKHVLATFLRDTLGIGASVRKLLEIENASLLPFYVRQAQKQSADDKRDTVDIVIFDLSLLSSEVLENVTALLGRLILEFLQRLGATGNGDMRGSLPVVLVLEEAHNYIYNRRSDDDESIARSVFERIAREGRKYGLSLVVASQRPSVLSKTVLSQCNSFIVHRLQNPEDLRYFREIVPAIYEPTLQQIPALAPQTALVLGECISAPALIKIREAYPLPKSQDPRFFKYWTASKAPQIDVEGICELWEGAPDAKTEKSHEQTAKSQPKDTYPSTVQFDDEIEDPFESPN